ncbi:MAG: UDP-N-acetylglucosamine 1-carboxyvinyltransferase [Clostridia bacterium]|nr:UDP-N-acetylglucosamine 1-carboxyvinyltransferase [Clostridia bacterium]
MKVYKIEGGAPLYGEIDVHGSKNAVLPILAATVINGGISVIHNCPKLSDVDSILNILKILGCSVVRKKSDVYIDSRELHYCDIPIDEMNKTRSSAMFAGALLARSRKAFIAGCGGCKIGKRPIDIHLKAFCELGVDITCALNGIECSARHLHPGKIRLDFPSVGATENIMLLASSVSGITTVENAAKEPEISNLADYLRSIGVDIRGDGTDCITIKGTCFPGNGEVTVIPDRIVASTYASAVATAGGEIKVRGINPRHCSSFLAYLRKTGMKIEYGEDFFEIKKQCRCKNFPYIITNPYPGFPTDCQPLAIASMAVAEGRGVIREKIFENRVSHCNQLKKMGAKICVMGRNLVVDGVSTLKGAHLEAGDLRCGASLVLAALGADGNSYISGIDYIERGYEDLCRDFSFLGANIERIE